LGSAVIVVVDQGVASRFGFDEQTNDSNENHFDPLRPRFLLRLIVANVCTEISPRREREYDCISLLCSSSVDYYTFS
jgi:hypothetical protein